MKMYKDVLAVLCFIFLHDMAAISSTGNNVNLALHKNASQSSSYIDVSKFCIRGKAELAVDGDTHNVFEEGSCTHTGLNKATWWEVDLTNHYRIGEIKILNRDVWVGRLHDVVVDVYHNKRKPRGGGHCTTHPGPAGPGWLNLSCDSPVTGRFVRITKPKNDEYDALTLCEVEISEDLTGSLNRKPEYNRSMYCESDSKFTASGQGHKFMSRSSLHCGFTCGVTPGCDGFSVTRKDDGQTECLVAMHDVDKRRNSEIVTTFYHLCG